MSLDESVSEEKIREKAFALLEEMFPTPQDLMDYYLRGPLASHENPGAPQLLPDKKRRQAVTQYLRTKPKSFQDEFKRVAY